MIVSSGIH